jgi:hypothetical protein
VSHDIDSNKITITFDVELIDVSDAEIALIEASLGELIQTMLLSQEEEG